MIQEATEILSQGSDLTDAQMQAVMEEIMSGTADTPAIVSFLSSLSRKGETAEELAAAVQVMRRHAIKIHTKHKVVLDTCGTGADSKGTFNISTAVAFVVSGCDIVVAKHGNRAVSSKSGSADILEALGVNIQMSAQKAKNCLDEIGIAFLFAQNFHPAMKYASAARKVIGKRTIFNLLGPLSNPAQATHQLIGVYDKSWLEIFAKVLANLGTRHALVVYGKDGLDEITTTTESLIYEEQAGKIKNYEIEPQDFGFKRASLSDLAGGTVSDNAKILLDVLKSKPGYPRDIVVLNAAAAIYTADKAKSIKEGIKLASESIDSGKAEKKLELLKIYSDARKPRDSSRG